MSGEDARTCRCGHERDSHWSYGVQQGRCEFCRCPGFHKTPLSDTPAVPDNAGLREALIDALRFRLIDGDPYKQADELLNLPALAALLAERAPAVPDNAGLRDELARALGEDLADALLSGPLAALLAERDDLAAKVAAVRELHPRAVSGISGVRYCSTCREEWPCETRRALGDPT